MNLLRKFVQHRYVKAIVTLVSGSMFAQCVTVVSSLLFARIYTPEELGVYTLILTAESLFGSVICLRYELLSVSEEDEQKVYAIIKLSTIIAIFLSVGVTVVYGGFQFVIKEEYRRYAYALFFIFLMLLGHGFISILDAYNNRCQQYKVMTSAYVLRTIVQNIGAIVLGVMGAGVFGIVLSHTIGLFFGLNKQAKSIKTKRQQFQIIQRNDIKKVMLENYRQPLYSSPAIFANKYSYSSINLFIESLFGASVLGYYSISYKALGLPLGVLSNNISKVFFREASREHEKTGGFAKTMFQISIVLSVIAIPMGILIYYVAPWAVKILLGNEWSKSADFIRILAPMFCIRFVCNAVAQGLQIVKKQSMELIFQLMLVLVSVICFLLSKYLKNDMESYLRMIAIGFSIIYTTYYLCVLYHSLKKEKKYENV